MPSYPPAAPTLTGDLLSIHRLLQTPTQIQRRLQTIADLRFVADQVLTQRFRSAGGAVLYEVSEPLTNTRTVESVAPGGEYPRDVTAEGAAALAAVSKWGEAIFLSDEKLKRSVYMGDEVDRNLRKVVATVVKHIDTVALAAFASAVTATQAATDDWVATTATILRDIELARADVEDLDFGYVPDSILLSREKYAYMVTDEKINQLRRRETTDNPVYGGQVETLAGLKVIKTSAARLPSNDVWIYDSKQVGGMADEMEVDPGYTAAEMAIQVQTERKAGRDGWDLWGRRITVPVITEPGAAIRITNTNP